MSIDTRALLAEAQRVQTSPDATMADVDAVLERVRREGGEYLYLVALQMGDWREMEAPSIAAERRDDMPGMTSDSPGARPPQVGVPRPPRRVETNEPFLAAGGREDPYQPPKFG